MKLTEFITTKEFCKFKEFTVLDIGARGHSLNGLEVLGNKLKYLGFEPDEQECQRLNNSVQRSGMFKYYPFVLSDKESQLVFYLTRDRACSSLLKPSKAISEYLNLADKLSVEQELILPAITLNSWKQRLDIGTIDYIKIDVQGAELSVLSSGKEVLRDAICVLCEVEFVEVYQNQPLFGEVDAFMRGNNFFLYDLKKVKSKRKNGGPNLKTNGQLVWGDAVYFKDVEFFFKKGNEDENYNCLIKYIILCEYFNILDFAIYLIEKSIEKKVIVNVEYIEHLNEIKRNIFRLYSLNVKMTNFDKLILSVINSSILKSFFSWTNSVYETDRFSKLKTHHKFFWKEYER